MTYHWPARYRREAAADALLAEQEAADAKFQAIVIAAKAAIEALDFPLGCPARGYDMKDVTGILSDWLAPRDPQLLQDLADDAVHDALFAEAA